MSKVRVKIDKAGVGELLRSEEVVAMLRGVAESRAAKLPAGYGVNVYIGRNRANAEIRAETNEAWRDNVENNTLVRVIS